MHNALSQRIPTDYAVPPGETLAEVLEERGMTQAEFARRTARPIKTINEIVRGKAAITPTTAIQFERVLGIPASFWNALEANHRDDRARLDERRDLGNHVEWLKQFPLKEMLRHGLIHETRDKVEQVSQLLAFFGVSSPDAWKRQWAAQTTQYRQAAGFAVSEPALAVWLRWGELDGAKLECAPFDQQRFRDVLTQIRSLTRAEPQAFVPAVQKLCASAGVAVVFTPELPMTRVSGAVRWLTQDKALMQLSLRYKRDDSLWFSFFHEAGHVLLHGRRRGHLDNDQGRGYSPPQEESEANLFASDFLIPPDQYRHIVETHSNSPALIEAFARRIGIAPGIVVGRLQYDGQIPWNSPARRLRRPLRWVESDQPTD